MCGARLRGFGFVGVGFFDVISSDRAVWIAASRGSIF
jgi:hypothetical protein